MIVVRRKMSDTITILGQKLKLVTPTKGQPYYEKAGSESELWIQALEPDPYFGYRTWRINVASLDGTLPMVEGSTLKEAEEALIAAIKKYETKTKAHLSKLSRLLEPKSSSRLERGPESVVVNGRTFTKEETLPHYSTLVEVYRAHPSFVLKRCVNVDRPNIVLWHVCYGRNYEDYEGYDRATPEIALRDAFESVYSKIENVSNDLKKRQEVLKSLEDLEKDLRP
jgi:hypothetical protein